MVVSSALQARRALVQGGLSSETMVPDLRMSALAGLDEGRNQRQADIALRAVKKFRKLRQEAWLSGAAGVSAAPQAPKQNQRLKPKPKQQPQ